MVDALAEVAPRPASADRLAKLSLLDRLEATVIGGAPVLRRYHEALCYLQAYPDDADVLARVDRALARWALRIGRLSRPARARLADSGIAGTTLAYPFGLAMARWLATTVPREVRIAWRGGEEGERLEETLSVLVTRAEGEAFTEGGPGWRRWLKLATGGRRLTELQLLIQIFDRAALDGSTRDWLFESLGLTLVWRLSPTGPSRTHARLAPHVHGSGEGRGRRAVSPAPRGRGAVARSVRRPLALQPAPAALAAALIEAARVAMATRARELFAFSFPNARDVLVADPEPGLRIALIGLPPDRRLPLDAYYGFLVLKNGVPVSYGGGWYLLGTLELGFNVFESFRHGESARLASEVLRVYHRVFRMRAVLVDRYQIGHDNDEALRSGAFYFYARLGFRPIDPETSRLARAERTRIDRQPGYRSARPILRRLARSDLVLRLNAGTPPPRVRAGALAALVSEVVARRFDGDRAAAARSATTRLGPLVGLARVRWRSSAERDTFETFALLLDLVPDLARWPRADRRALGDIVRAKMGPDERTYARLLDGHHRLGHALASLSGALDR